MTTFDRTNPFQTDMFEKNVLMPYLKDYRNVSAFARFMGGSDAVIYNKFQHKGQGDLIIFPLRQTFDPVIAIGSNQLEGNESELTYVSDGIYINNARFAILLTNEHLMNLQTKFHLASDVRQDLLDKADIFNTKRIVTAFPLAFNGQTYPTNEIPDYPTLTARMLAANLDVLNAGMSRSRVLIGNNYLATHATFALALLVANLPVANHKLTVKHIRDLHQLASTGESNLITGGGGAAFTSSESAIRPYKYKTLAGFEDKRYVLFISPRAYSALVDDPAWQAQVNRGVIENENQPSVLYGSMYKGTIEGVMVIVIPEFNKLTITNAAGNTYAYSALCGASAIGFGMGSIPTFTARSSTDYEMKKGLSHNEISGIKVLKFPSKSIGTKGNNTNLVEYGVIHSFTTLS